MTRTPALDDGLPTEAAGAIRAIRAGAPDVAPEAARTLAVLFDGHVPVPPSEAAPLNMGGGPVEFSCSGADLRYTVDIGGPVETRLARIRDRIRVLDPAWACPALDGWEPGGPLRWGAWLGVRHRAGRPPGFKIYVETPPGAASGASGGWTVPWPGGGDRRLSPTLAGFEGTHIEGSGEGGRREVYFEMPRHGMPAAWLERIMAEVGLERRAAELIALVDAFEFRHPGGALPDARLGFSYRLDRHGRAPVFSLFAFAADLVGDDRAIRRQILRRAAVRNIDLGPYEALTAPLAEGPPDADAHTDVHNIIAFVIDGAAAPTLQITFRPPGTPGEGARHD
ncbi:hypothetical protein [Roseomonas genomospecies 6]|uniref:Uncharacterized protein n=1 Tax=Roseomonas genomospecies 6 TaxID=214106 RepID=A0A9W7NFW1_9PROT|nr:hypothetical protein [Roseomonas genomospecies 6]KAA0677163.1 hypothetical protein DS843_24540 [Roseomonas genomospecies 6]